MTVMRAEKVAGILLAGLLTVAGGVWAQRALSASSEAEDPAAASGPSVRADVHGDPLPSGALARFGSTRLRHVGSVEALVWSPNGKLLASAGEDDTVRIWDAATGRLVRLIPHPATCLAFLPGSEALVGGAFGEIRAWEIATGKEPLRLDLLTEQQRRGLQDPLSRSAARRTQFAVSPDGRLLATAAMKTRSAVAVWDLRTGQQRFPLQSASPPSHVAFTPDGKRIVTADTGKSLVVWDAHTRKKAGGFPVDGPERVWNLSALAVSPDNQHVALKVLGQLLIAELTSGKVVWRQRDATEDDDSQIAPVAFSPDGQMVALSAPSGVRIWDWRRGHELARINEGGDLVRSACAFSPDGRRLAWGGIDGKIHIWDLATLKEALPQDGRSIAAFALHPDGKAFITLDEDWWWTLRGRRRYQTFVRLWSTVPGASNRTIALPNLHPDKVAFSRDGRTLVLGDFPSGGIAVLDPSGKGVQEIIPGPVKGRCTVALGPGGERAALKTPDTSRLTHLIAGTGREWTAVPGQDVVGGFLPAYRAAFTPDGKHLIVVSDNALVSLDTTTIRERWRVKVDYNYNYVGAALAVSPDSLLVAVGTSVGREQKQGAYLRLFDAATGQERAKFRAPHDNITAAAFSPDGRFLIAASTPWYESYAGELAKRFPISLWEVTSRKEIRRFQGHEGEVRGLAFAPDSRSFYSASADGTVLQWDPLGLRDAEVLHRHDAAAAWDDLAADDVARAYRAVVRLVASPAEACALLSQHLSPAQPIPAERMRALIRDLDSKRFAEREAASRELLDLGEEGDIALHEALERRPSLEVRRRIKALIELRSARPYSGDELRRCRAVLVLEWIGSDAARSLAKRLASGTVPVAHVRDARAALERLTRSCRP
jgi:WD40 repeat protein